MLSNAQIWIKSSFTLSIFYFLLSLFSFSQNSQWQKFGINEGLPQSNITSITQDKIGYLWLGTKGSGLVRFDGKNYKTFSLKDSLPSTFINDLYFKNDSLFIATNQGLGILSKGKIWSFQSPKINKIFKIKNDIFLVTDLGIYLWKGNYVLPLRIDSEIDINPVNDLAFFNNQYWICTSKGLWSAFSLTVDQNAVLQRRGNFSSIVSTHQGLFVSDYKKGLYKKTGNYFELQKELRGINSVVSIDEKIYLLTSNSGVLKYDSTLNKTTSFSSQNFKYNNIQDLYLDKSKNLWVATNTKGIFKYTQNNFEHFTTKRGLASNKINALYSTKDSLFIASNNNGIQVFYADDFLHIKPEELKNTSINTMALDSSQNLWLGTLNKGLILLKKDSTDISGYKMIPIGNELQSIGKSIRNITIQNNQIWLTDSKQIHQLITENGIVKKINSYGKDQGVKDENITSLKFIDKQLYYTTQSGNLGVFNGRYFIEHYQILGQKIPIISLTNQKEHLYLGTLGNGVWVASKKNPKETFQLKGKKQLNSQNIKQLLFDQNGALWIGTERGLNKVILDDNTIKDVFYFGKNDGFLGIESVANAATQDKKGNIWFGTVNGLTKLVSTNTSKQNLVPRIHLESVNVNFQDIESLIPKSDNIIELQANQNNISFHYKTIDLNHPNDIEYSWKLNDSFSPWTRNTSIDFANLDYGNYTFTVKSRNRDWIESETQSFQFTILKPWYLQDWTLIWFVTILMILSWATISFYLKRIKKKSQQKVEKLQLDNKLISLEQKALQLQMNPHFVFNVLNSIKAYGTTGKLTKMNETVSEFAVLLRGVLQNSREEFVSIKSELEIINNYCLLEQKLNSNSFDFEFNIQLNSFDAEEVLIPSMIMQPFIENSIKHGFKNLDILGTITLSLELKNNHIICSIQDNGVGYYTSQRERMEHHKSVALEVTKERLISLIKYPNFSIKEIKENEEILGTLVTFNLPYKTDF